MTEHAYDPATPYVVAGRESGILYARFRHEEDAQGYADTLGFIMIDTTPKPKIPVDAQFVYWRDEDDQPYFARKDGTTNLWETDEGFSTTTDNLVADIGDAEVTVLVPKKAAA